MANLTDHSFDTSSVSVGLTSAGLAKDALEMVLPSGLSFGGSVK